MFLLSALFNPVHTPVLKDTIQLREVF